MTEPGLFILYVDNPPASTEFYTTLFGKGPIEASPTFAMFALDAGVMFGLWSRHTVEPAAMASGGGGEIAFPVADAESVNRLFADWTQRGLSMAQEPTTLDFGYTFVALDPDGHRLRVFAPTPA